MDQLPRLGTCSWWRGRCWRGGGGGKGRIGRRGGAGAGWYGADGKGKVAEERGTYEPCFEHARAGDRWPVVPEKTLARDEVAEGGGEEEEAAEDAEDVEEAYSSFRFRIPESASLSLFRWW